MEIRLDKFFLSNKKFRYYFPLTTMSRAIRWANKISKTIGKPVISILDVGCGPGIPANNLSCKGNGKFRIIGLDIFLPDLLNAKKYPFWDLVLADIRYGLPFREKSFDIVLCIDVLEHLYKDDGVKLLQEFERIAKYGIVLSCPVGFVEFNPCENNEFLIHRSGWYPHELQKRGYIVRGNFIRIGYPKSFGCKLICYALVLLFCAPAYFYPELAVGMVGKKILGK